jgi:hypothetical protein
VSPDTGETAAGQQRSFVPDALGEHAWLYRLNARLWKTAGGSNATVALAAWATSGSGNPSTRRGKTAAFTVSGAAETTYTANLEAVVQGSSGEHLSYGYLATAAGVRHGMTQQANIPDADNTLFYNRTGLAQPPASPNGYTSSSVEGWLSVWADYEANVAPDKPAVVTVAGVSSTNPVAPSSIATLTPVIVGQFRDDNEAVGSGPVFGVGDADKLYRFQYQVILSSGALHYDSGAVTADAAEQTARAFTRTYAGTALVAGTTYKLRVRVYDLFDAASDWSDYRSFVVGAGAMDSPTTPAGKQETQTPGPFAATWQHAGALSTNAVQVRIKDATTGAVLRDTGTLTKTVANNAVSSVTWAQTGFAALPWGTNAVWEMRGRDTAGNWGAYSEAVAFTVNAAPSVPALPQPLTPAVARPLVLATVTDADDDNTTGLLVKLRVKDAAGAVLFTRTMTFVSRNATTGVSTFSYQITATDWATFATYKLDAYSFDGTVYSGGTTVEASATKSTERTVVYASGPIPTITAPADGGTITTNTPTITWTVSGTQVKYRVRVYLVSTGALLHDTGDVTSAAGSYVLPSTLSTGSELHEGDQIDVMVTVTDAAPLSGSDTNRTTLDYATPATLAVTISLEYAQGDAVPSVVVATWPQSAYPVGEFAYYRLTRTPTAEALLSNPDLSAETVNFGRFTSVTQTRHEDHTARAGVEYEYRLKQFVDAGADRIGSVESVAVATIAFDVTIIHDVRDPSGSRIVLAARKDRTITLIHDSAVLMPWNQRAPLHLHGEVSYVEIDAEYTILAASAADANAIVRRARLMAQSGGPLHYRDGRGNAWFGEFAEPPVEIDPPGGGPRRLRVRFRELAWDESITDE